MKREKQQLCFIIIVLISIILAASFVIYKLDLMRSSTPSDIPWQNPIEHPATSIAVDDEKVYITDDTGNVRCFDNQNGEDLWNASAGGYVSHYWREHRIAIIENRLYVAYENARVSCFDKNNGTLLWTIQNAMNEGYFYRYPSIRFEDDLMYVITDGISARVAITGELLWEVNPFLEHYPDYQTRVYLLGGNFLDEEFVYAAGDDFSNMHYYKINIKNGNIVWRSNVTWDGSLFALGGYFIPSIAANVQGRSIISMIYEGTSYSNQLICLDSNSGEELWSIDVGADEGQVPILYGPTVYNDLFLFAKADGYLYAVNVMKGKIEWKAKVDTNNLFSYNSAFSGQIQASSIQIDDQNQRLFWCLNVAESGPLQNYTGTLCNLDLSNGNVNWIKHLENENASFGTLSLAYNNETDKIFLTKNKGLWIFEVATGDLVQSKQFEDYVLPPVFQGDETFIAADLRLFAITNQENEKRDKVTGDMSSKRVSNL